MGKTWQRAFSAPIFHAECNAVCQAAMLLSILIITIMAINNLLINFIKEPRCDNKISWLLKVIMALFTFTATSTASCAVHIWLLTSIQCKDLHPLLQLQMIISQQDSGTGDNDINIGFTIVPSTFQPLDSIWYLWISQMTYFRFCKPPFRKMDHAAKLQLESHKSYSFHPGCCH